MSRIGNGWDRLLRRAGLRYRLADDGEYVQRREWALSYIPSDADASDAYAVAEQYSRERYDEIVTEFGAVDAKADGLTRYVGAGIAMVGGLVALLSGRDGALVPIADVALLVSVGLLSLSFIAAVWARTLVEVVVPGVAKQLLDIIEQRGVTDPGRLMALTVAMRHVAERTMRRAHDEKARRLRWAEVLVVAALCCLSAGLIISLAAIR